MAEHRESESELVARAQTALSQCSWTVGECAATWTQRYSKGRTDGDFGALIGLSGDQVYQRRRVWEGFGDVREEYPNLKWSHFYTALTWDDAAECLQWANEMQASIAEMKAWRRAQRGENLQEAGDEQPPFDPLVEFMSPEMAAVRSPDEPVRRGFRETVDGDEERERTAVATGVARAAGSDEEYAPFGKQARGSIAPETSAGRAEPSSEQIYKRLSAALEKCDEALTPGIIEDFSEIPLAVQQRFLDAMSSLSGKAAGLR